MRYTITDECVGDIRVYECYEYMKRQLKVFDTEPVSYTHLDVYKRQVLFCSCSIPRAVSRTFLVIVVLS